MLVEPTCEFGSEPRDRLEQLLRRNRAAQAFELRPAAGADHLRDRLGQHRADAWQSVETFNPLALQECSQSSSNRTV